MWRLAHGCVRCLKKGGISAIMSNIHSGMRAHRLNTFVELFETRQDALAKKLQQCEDVKASSDCIEAMIEELFCVYARQDVDLDAARIKALGQVACTAAAGIGAVSQAEVYEIIRPRKPKRLNAHRVLAYVPCVLMAGLCVFLYWNEQTNLAMGALLAAAVSLILLFVQKTPDAVEVNARPTIDMTELMRRLRTLMRTLDEAVLPVAELSEPDDLPRPLLEGVQMLMEAHFTQDGDFALKSISRLSHAFGESGVEFAEYTRNDRADFDLLAAQQGGQTIRPAVYKGGKLVLRGQATVAK